jgi:hypothetical protein
MRDKKFLPLPLSDITSIERGSISLYPVVTKFESTRNFQTGKISNMIIFKDPECLASAFLNYGFLPGTP